MDLTTVLTWVGIGLCVLQSGSFSGLNLSLFGISALRLEVQAAAGNPDAAHLLVLRRDSNFLLSTVLWGNVGTNVLLALLTDSVLAGAAGFVFSTFVITLGGEILPQAYFSRNALRMATRMRPFLRVWQLLLYPLAKPTALLLDWWLGGESLLFLREAELRELIKRYVSAPGTEIDHVEGIGALNFLSIDDLAVGEEGERIDPLSLIELPEENGRLVLPRFEASPQDPFIRQVQASGKAWVVLTSPEGVPRLALEADGFLRAALLGQGHPNIEHYCHEPQVVEDETTKVGDVLPLLRSGGRGAGDDVIPRDLILVWGRERRIITGTDILGRLLRGIASPSHA